MVKEEIEPQPEEAENTSEVRLAQTPDTSEVSQETPLRWREKLKLHKFKVLGGILGAFVLAGAALGAYKLGQREIQPTPSEGGERVICRDPRPQLCTMECIVNPPYICGPDGKSYCSVCQACANPKVRWYIIQDTPCGTE